MSYLNIIYNNTGCSSSCPTTDNCSNDVDPVITLKRHDTYPSLKIAMETCDGILDLSDENLAVEVSLWTKAKLRKAITEDDVYFQLADNIGFEQVMVGDVIIMDRQRLPEYMLVDGFDEENCLIHVQRGYHSTTPSAWKKGSKMRIFRTFGAPGEIQTELSDITQEDGSVLTDQVTATYLVYDWSPGDTCVAGCFWLEFKLLMLSVDEVESMSFNEISNISFTPSTLSVTDFGCTLGDGVSWVRRFPSDSEGFVIKVVDSATSEL